MSESKESFEPHTGDPIEIEDRLKQALGSIDDNIAVKKTLNLTLKAIMKQTDDQKFIIDALKKLTTMYTELVEEIALLKLDLESQKSANEESQKLITILVKALKNRSDQSGEFPDLDFEKKGPVEN